ncbi:MAG TPA: Crp/Fnr family transcriptional regulator [Solirubrobacter sp.]|nr:Crp/Fnr family transcriptional regulator [Solirubrobacter sp.]
MAVPWPILAGVPEDDARRVLQIARRRVFARREVVFHRGDPADTLHLVHKGHFAVRIGTPLGDTVMLNLIGPGDTFGEIALLDEVGPRSATVVALEAAETRAIHKLDFDALRGRHPAVADVLARALALQVRRLSELLLEAHYVAADRRVLRRLAALGGGGVVPLTQEEISNLAGTSRATVNRVLREAQARGELALRRGRIEVLDATALAARAG